ncbi:ferric reductase NAD binding domain-containing protein [Trametes punicea]|nr:ferric reductase NAD binding domain-containing protein [Trametes punicea]
MAAASSSAMTAGHSGGTQRVKHSSSHGEYVWYAILGLLGLATIVNVLYLVWAACRRHRSRQARSKKSAPLSPGRLALRRLPQAILSGARIAGFRLRIPYIDMTLLELTLAVVYLGGCLAWVLAPTDSIKPRTNLQPNTWALNAGKLAAGQLPLAVLLALKNNPVTWLTGISHEKLVLMHRMVSRCIFVLTWMHLIGEYCRSPAQLLNAQWKVAGLVGAVAQTITTLFGIQCVRRRFYEVFYSTHVVLILIFIVCIHIHATPKHYDTFVWPVWVIWGFDRLLRGGRYLLFNVVLKPKHLQARVESIGANGLRVSLRRRIPGGWKAGQHVFLAFPRLGIESHPFTISNVYEKDESGEAEMVFIIRAMGGQTRMLHDLAMRTGSCELTALFDGPYGHPEDIRPFSTCVFIAGGTGVTYTIARMHQLFKDVHASNACATRVVFVWAVRTDAEYNWIAADLSKIVSVAPPSVSLAVEIFLTGPRQDYAMESVPTLHKELDIEKDPATWAKSEVQEYDRKAADTCSRAQDSGVSTPTKGEAEFYDSGTATPTASHGGGLPHQRIMRRFGRPDVRKLLEEEVTASEGTVAVDVSGPDGLVSAVRSALSEPFAGPVATMKGTPTILLSVEQFRM